MLGVRRLEGIDLKDFRNRTGRDLESERAAKIQRLEKEGFLHRPLPQRLALTESGLLVSDSVIAELL